MKSIIAIGTGSFIGGVLRYLLSQFIDAKFPSAFPFGTLCVNVAGCFAIGMVFALADTSYINDDWRLFLATGICGGFTTFSAFSNETFGLLREGEIWKAAGYVLASIVLGLLATFMGFTILKMF
jgi:fluoride exporter